jgi:hypothetical protein
MNLNQQTALPANLSNGTATNVSAGGFALSAGIGAVITRVTLWIEDMPGDAGWTIIQDDVADVYWARYLDPSDTAPLVDVEAFIPISESASQVLLETDLAGVNYSLSGYWYVPYTTSVLYSGLE